MGIEYWMFELCPLVILTGAGIVTHDQVLLHICGGYLLGLIMGFVLNFVNKGTRKI